jgi:hypothetical protein
MKLHEAVISTNHKVMFTIRQCNHFTFNQSGLCFLQVQLQQLQQFTTMRTVMVVLVLMAWVGCTLSRPRRISLGLCEQYTLQSVSEFNFGSLFTNGLGAVFNTAIARDCKGRAQGDYFYGCQVN